MKNKVTPLGLKIRNAIAERGMSQREFAKSIGIAEETLSRVIYGVQRGRYSETTVLKIVSALDISLA